MTVDVLIIGAGICGVTIARGLEQVIPGQWILLDKGRSVGGRLATRRIGMQTFDHGAQFFTVRSHQFTGLLRELLSANVAKEWCRGFQSADLSGPSDGYPRYAAVGGMNKLVKFMARDLPVQQVICGRRVVRLEDIGSALRAFDQDGGFIDARYVVLTAPVPQSLDIARDALLAASCDDVVASLSSIHYEPCLAVLGTFETEYLPNFNIPVQCATGPLAFVSDNGLKGVCSSAGALTIHLSHDLSRTYFDQSDADVFTATLKALDEVFPGYKFRPLGNLSVQRWRYATPKTVFNSAFLEVSIGKKSDRRSPKLFFAGEAFGGPKIEGAFLSGLAVRDRISKVGPSLAE